MRVRTSAVRLLSSLLIAIALTVAVSPAQAQEQGRKGGKPAATPPGQAKKQVTSAQAVIVSREILVKYGYQIVRVETVRGTEVIYYRRGNNGRGRGLGPIEKMVVRPSGTIVVFEAAPEKVLIDIKLRLGL